MIKKLQLGQKRPPVIKSKQSNLEILAAEAKQLVKDRKLKFIAAKIRHKVLCDKIQDSEIRCCATCWQKDKLQCQKCLSTINKPHWKLRPSDRICFTCAYINISISTSHTCILEKPCDDYANWIYRPGSIKVTKNKVTIGDPRLNET